MKEIMDWDREAEKLMAATEFDVLKNQFGMDFLEGYDLYGKKPGTIERKEALANYLRSFAARVIGAAKEEKARREMEQLNQDLERYNKR